MGNLYKPLPESIGIKALAEFSYTDFKYELVLFLKRFFFMKEKMTIPSVSCLYFCPKISVAFLFFLLLYLLLCPSQSYAQKEENKLTYPLVTLGSSALTLNKGKGLGRTTLLYYNEIQYGLTKHWSVGLAGTSGVAFLIFPSPIVLSTRLSTGFERGFNVAVTGGIGKMLVIFHPLAGKKNRIIKGGLAMTYGDYHKNIGFSFDGYYLSDGLVFNQSEYYYNANLNGTIWLGKKNYLVLEGGLFRNPKDYKVGYISANFSHVRKNISFIFGGFFSTYIDDEKDPIQFLPNITMYVPIR